jgi:protein-glutamine gamma-glutamyltransferase
VLTRLKSANTRPPPEESIALRAVVLLAVMAAATAVLRQDVGGAGLTVACLVGIPGGHVLSHVGRHRDGFLLKAGLAAGLLLAFANFLASMGQLGLGSLAEVQIPLSELFLWVQVLHSLDVPARRDLLFSLASSVLLVAVAGVLSVSVALTPHLVVWAVAFVASLVLAHRSELAELPPLATGPRPSDRGVLRSAGAAAAVVMVLAAAVFLVAPAPRPPETRTSGSAGAGAPSGRALEPVSRRRRSRRWTELGRCSCRPRILRLRRRAGHVGAWSA